MSTSGSQLLLVGRQHRFRRGELLEHELNDLDARLVHAGHDVLGHGHRRGHDMHVRLQPRADHPDRVRDAILAVHRELSRHDVDDLVVLGDLHPARRVDDPGTSSRLISRSFPDTATTPRLLNERTFDPETPTQALEIWTPAMISASSAARLIASIVASTLTMFPLRVPRLAAALADHVQRPARVLLSDEDTDLRGSDVGGNEEILGFGHQDITSRNSGGQTAPGRDSQCVAPPRKRRQGRCGLRIEDRWPAPPTHDVPPSPRAARSARIFLPRPAERTRTGLRKMESIIPIPRRPAR